ncbi:methyltransferase domain-containing protein [Paenisporosarcina antarctica]|uniref:Methyltransferase domain-containing protein n=1 Tax=Paenisporosarcina antarctica TaxID=417367 RepID=A0A4P6ZUI6_9BACL|nr:methyltransferase domain-containing protein [Paenisporosarcina antarctica]QBP40140.1 methyltransferase domain-containing protein [Paenisporosarcina antarctica]
MNNEFLETIVECMATNKEMSNIQKVQTEHRVKLVEFWGIKEGSRVLEIGCGQGDTTAVLAYFVGEKGLVHGIDSASLTYGSPISLGDSAEYLMQSKLGKQIKFDFEIDLLSSNSLEIIEDYFDYIVFSHCSWYLKSLDELRELMQKIKKWGKQLCFAEWDSRIKTIEQYPHLLSILIQAQYESFKDDSVSNIRTLFTPKDIKSIVESSGWTIINDETIDCPELQDGNWEINKVVIDIEDELNKTSDIPIKLKELIQSEVMLLEEFINSNQVKPLPTYAFIAVKQ